MTKPYAPISLAPALKSYAWGTRDVIPRLLRSEVRGAEPTAEAWFGTHASGPATVSVSGHDEPLPSWLATHAEDYVAPAQKRTGELPYLLKLLSAEHPLSVQVHPNRAQARAGFEREVRAKIPAAATERAYPDAGHKPELLVALSPFWALAGFRPLDEIAEVLGRLPELQAVLPAFVATEQGLRDFLAAYLTLPAQKLERPMANLLTRLRDAHAAAAFGRERPEFWALRSQDALGTLDPGILFVFLLGLTQLEVGDGIFLAAGVPHSYLQGTGVEIMATSDNVLRAGLTAKHVSPEELLAVVRYDARPPPLLQPLWNASRTQATYATPADEFSLQRLELSSGTEVARATSNAETWLALAKDGTVGLEVTGSNFETTLLSTPGAMLLPRNLTLNLRAKLPTTLFIACPPPSEAIPSFRATTPTRLSFGTSGLRGLVADITDLEAYINTRGFLEYLISEGLAVSGTRVATGGDLRPSTHNDDPASPSILRAVTRAVLDLGMGPVYCGRLPTPALTYYGIQQRIPSIMVTGSHIPFDRNGIKFCKPSGEVLKSDEAPILRSVERVRMREYRLAPEQSLFENSGRLKLEARVQIPAAAPVAADSYRQRYLTTFGPAALAGVRVALYEHSAVGRQLVARVLRDLGAKVFAVGRSDEFVAIDTEALSAAQLSEMRALASKVEAEHGAVDALISTDGDSDRPLLLATGASGAKDFIPGDVLGALVAGELSADAVAVPISSNELVDEHMGASDVTVERTRIGSPWVIAAMQSIRGKRVVGWEANGGFMVHSPLPLPGGTLLPLPTRDAVLPIVVALAAKRREGISLGEILTRLPKRFGHAGLLDNVALEVSRSALARLQHKNPSIRRIERSQGAWRASSLVGDAVVLSVSELEECHTIAQRLTAVFSEERGFGALLAVDYLDGIRCYFDNGDVAHLRPSGNAPQLRLYAVADSASRAEAIIAMGLKKPDGLLSSLLAQAPA